MYYITHALTQNNETTHALVTDDTTFNQYVVPLDSLNHDLQMFAVSFPTKVVEPKTSTTFAIGNDQGVATKVKLLTPKQTEALINQHLAQESTRTLRTILVNVLKKVQAIPDVDLAKLKTTSLIDMDGGTHIESPEVYKKFSKDYKVHSYYGIAIHNTKTVFPKAQAKRKQIVEALDKLDKDSNRHFQLRGVAIAFDYSSTLDYLRINAYSVTPNTLENPNNEPEPLYLLDDVAEHQTLVDYIKDEAIGVREIDKYLSFQNRTQPIAQTKPKAKEKESTVTATLPGGSTITMPKSSAKSLDKSKFTSVVEDKDTHSAQGVIQSTQSHTLANAKPKAPQQEPPRLKPEIYAFLTLNQEIVGIRITLDTVNLKFYDVYVDAIPKFNSNINPSLHRIELIDNGEKYVTPAELNAPTLKIADRSEDPQAIKEVQALLATLL